MSSSQMLGALLLMAVAPGMQAESLEAIVQRLSAASSSSYHATARYEVLLPQSEEPVAYSVSLNSSRTQPSDTLAPCCYLIDWTAETPSGRARGFCSYFYGHHYRFRDKRLQEYHYDDDSTPFYARGTTALGVQQQAQFASLLPDFIAERLREIQHDSSYTYTITTDSVRHTVSIEGKQEFAGCEGLDFKYTFSTATGLPVASDFCYNPGQMSEQSVSVEYGAPDVNATDSKLSEPLLMALYPEAFSRYRESGYTLANLPGRPLPAFSAPTHAGERFTYHIGQGFASPTVIAVLDADVDGCSEMVETLRTAVETSPTAASLILAFVSNHPETIAEAIGVQNPGESILSGAKGLARDCGVTATPAIIVCSKDGMVQNAHSGRNKDLAAIVIQEISLAN